MCFEADRPSFQECSFVVARKEHRCCECRVIIGRGEKYERFTGRWGKMQTFHTCGRCAELRQTVVDFEESVGCDSSESWPPFGHLMNALHEMGEYD